ncbi:MHS family MFS transporter [Pseudonocardia sp. RS11V-5]|uniref:MFS transporter n=1 Tax=Pseudonocardia terrae TaxID=2905831 RepID=UPI001E2BF368|nr:MFS transporter [Pseudonocardia terrae]MCE3551401.1 MHS family MFS transporter [Pseudonocardia terrae]
MDVTPSPPPASIRQVAFAGFVGSMVEWYDFYIYGTASALVLGKIFFPEFSSTAGTLAAFATFGAGFFARPLGAVVIGHFGDRIGRKSMLALTLVLMGVSTALIGLLPPFSSIGIWASVLLVLLRLVQGFAVGGEWGGAAVMVVEYAPERRRGFYSALPSSGNATGLVLANGIFALVSLLPRDQFLSWGWRLPFLASLVLVAVGLYVRIRLVETPEFRRMQKAATRDHIPFLEILRHHKRPALLAMGMAAGLFSLAYVAITFVVSYAGADGKLSSTQVLFGVTVAAACATVLWPLIGRWSDRIGRRPLFLAGAALAVVYAFPFFWLVDSGNVALTWIAIVVAYAGVVGLYAGPMAAYFAELFSTDVRYTGASIGYQGSALVAGGLTPFIATALAAATGGSSWLISVYIMAVAVITFGCAWVCKETSHAPLQDSRLDAARATGTEGQEAVQA